MLQFLKKRIYQCTIVILLVIIIKFLVQHNFISSHIYCPTNKKSSPTTSKLKRTVHPKMRLLTLSYVEHKRTFWRMWVSKQSRFPLTSTVWSKKIMQHNLNRNLLLIAPLSYNYSVAGLKKKKKKNGSLRAESIFECFCSCIPLFYYRSETSLA